MGSNDTVSLPATAAVARPAMCTAAEPYSGIPVLLRFGGLAPPKELTLYLHRNDAQGCTQRYVQSQSPTSETERAMQTSMPVLLICLLIVLAMGAEVKGDRS
jgi:hypothetical protein